MFVPSGTFGNELALFTLCRRGQEVVLAESSHIVQHEAGAAAIIAGVQLRTFVPAGACPRWEEIRPRTRAGDDIHAPIPAATGDQNVLVIHRLEQAFDQHLHQERVHFGESLAQAFAD